MAISGFPSTFVNGIQYFRAKNVAIALGYRNTGQACRLLVDTGNRTPLKDIHPHPAQLAQYEANAVYLTADGLKQLALRSFKPESMAMAEELGFELVTKYTRKEQEIVGQLRVFLEGLSVVSEYQKTVGRYRVDMYLPSHRLALEIDEFGHRHRDPAYEQCREDFIRKALGCDFMRVNPDAPDFSIFKLCAQLASRIMVPSVSVPVKHTRIGIAVHAPKPIRKQRPRCGKKKRTAALQ